MNTFNHTARSLRLRRLHHHGAAGLVIAPVDHSIADGPVATAERSLDQLVGELVGGQVDGVVLHKGSVRHVDPERFADASVIIHLNASTRQAPDPDAKYMVTEVEEAIRLGADAVSVHVNLGAREERLQIQNLAQVAGACERWNLPLMAMVYPRGPKVTDPCDPILVAHAVTVAADLGADLVKTVFPGSVEHLRAITSACPIPVLIAGGPRRGTDAELLRFISDAMSGGAAGVAVGRNLFQAPDPQGLATQISRLVHQDQAVHFEQMMGDHHGEQQAVLA